MVEMPSVSANQFHGLEFRQLACAFGVQEHWQVEMRQQDFAWAVIAPWGLE
jgi:hypothetical protein